MDIEYEYLMPNSSESTSDDEIKAHHASEISHPHHLRICLRSEPRPTDRMLKFYFKFQMQKTPLNRRIEELSTDQQVDFIAMHRQWAVQVMNHSVLHQVTNALVTIADEKRKEVICKMSSESKLLQQAVSSSNR